MHHNHRCGGRRRQSRARSPKSIPNETTENRVLRLFPRSRPPSEVLSSFRTLQIRRCRATVTVMRARTGGHPGFENLPNGMLVYWPAVLALVKIRMLSTSILESSVSIHLTDVLIAATRISISHEFFPRENINRPLWLLVRSEKSVSNLPNLPSSKARQSASVPFANMLTSPPTLHDFIPASAIAYVIVTNSGGNRSATPFGV